MHRETGSPDSLMTGQYSRNSSCPEGPLVAETQPPSGPQPRVQSLHRLAPALATWLLRKLMARLGNPPVEIILWNGESVYTAKAPPRGRIIIRNRKTFVRLLFNPTFAFGDTYSAGDIDVEGNFVDILESLYLALEQADDPGFFGRIVEKLRVMRRHYSPSASRESIHHHYDIGNEFYKLWLDERMLYTCAYYPHANMTLEQAQVAKLDHVCRKLRLSPGETVVEAGCGWGALALHMAQHYGVKVRAFNIAKEQLQYARERAQAAGLSSRVEFVDDDYRNISGKYDAFVSVGMLEHVGPENYAALGKVIDRTLSASGRGLIHSIGRNFPRMMHPWIERRIFPGACPPSIRQMLTLFEPFNLSVLDVENLRLHYARTLQHWLDRFEAAAPRVREMFDEKFVRMWRLYLAGSVATFLAGELQLFQVVFARVTKNDLPWSRAHLYDESTKQCGT